MRSAGRELHQWLNAEGNDKADDNANKGLPEITTDHVAQVAAFAIGESDFKFLFFDSKGDFTAANESEKHPGGAERKGR